MRQGVRARVQRYKKYRKKGELDAHLKETNETMKKDNDVEDQASMSVLKLVPKVQLVPRNTDDSAPTTKHVGFGSDSWIEDGSQLHAAHVPKEKDYTRVQKEQWIKD